MRRSTEGIGWPVIIVYIIAMNMLRSYAKKTGGIENPIRKMKTPRLLSFSASALFLGGVLIAIFVNPLVIWVSVLCIPTYAAAIFLTLKTVQTEETDLLDDFLDEDL